MDKTIEYSIIGVFALIIFFSLTPTLASTLDTAQHDTTPYSNTTELTDIVTTQTNVVIANDTVSVNDTSLASEYSVQDTDADRLRLAIDSISGDITVNGETVNSTGEYQVEGGSATVETTGGGADYTITSVDADVERENAGLMALVLLIFIVAFAAAMYKAVM